LKGSRKLFKEPSKGTAEQKVPQEEIKRRNQGDLGEGASEKGGGGKTQIGGKGRGLTGVKVSR